MIGQDESNCRLAETITGILSLDTVAMEAGRARQDQLTKPSGSLGRLEALSVQLAAHRSVEPGHRAVLEHLQLLPLLDLDLRLGEGTVAALGISLCVAACKVLDEMATFAEAGVSGKAE